MSHIKWTGVTALILMLSFQHPITGVAQSNSSFTTEGISASPISISDQLTTNLIFPQAIISVDRGSRNILVQKARTVENILQVKAENNKLADSNLTVITADGKFYSFTVKYLKDPRQLNLKILPESDRGLAEFEKDIPSEVAILETAKKVAIKNRKIKPIRQRKYMTGLSLTGIYIEDDLLYFQIKLENQTNINYDVDQFRFFIRDNKQGKRTASQELEQIPVMILGKTGQIPAQSTQTLVVALSKFTIPDQKHLGIQLMEQQGGRHLKIKVKNRHIIQAFLVE
ncbi:conjugative transposon protein TraN [Algoriphagus sp. D3-2-R+10]|uniref:conjugative transposon protein TraN n=1 Tax=Algoriphagus aurantiacus TaxID=3103948 RepID=UPI002B3AB4B7|nr:conjugative transposon protein TraN [Algoriphagus sp. D3-2-R+10]MEB2774635.1 conjugative transposon protein TraN [Algoriphagus sp. D3-2-R+10]